MTKRERLIEICDTNNGWTDEVPVEQFADYLIENGIIVPPCKVGDTIYEFCDVKGFYGITELMVEDIVICVKSGNCKLYCKSKQSNSEYIFHRDRFGKTIFFTREEAEKELTRWLI